MGEQEKGNGHDPAPLFQELKDRPTPELDSDRLWKRVAAGLTPRRAHWWQGASQPKGGLSGGDVAHRRPVLARLAYAVAAISVLALATWAGIALMGGEAAVSPEEAGQLAEATDVEAGAQSSLAARVIRLAPPLPDVPAVTTEVSEERLAVSLDVRLVRGFSGPVPEDVQTMDPFAAGGADVLADVRPEVTSLPFEQYGLVGRWEGELPAIQEVEAGLSSEYALSFQTSDRVLAGNYVELTDVRLVGAIDLLVASSLRLEPGRLYLLGVVEPGEEAPSIILAIRAEADDVGTESPTR